MTQSWNFSLTPCALNFYLLTVQQSDCNKFSVHRRKEILPFIPLWQRGARGFGLFALRFGKSQSNSKYVPLNFRELVLLEKWEITEPTGGVHFDAVAPVSDFSDDSCGNRRMT